MKPKRESHEDRMNVRRIQVKECGPRSYYIVHVYKSSSANVYFTISRVIGDEEETVYRDAKMTMTAMSKREECEIRRKKDGRVSRKIVINGGL